MSLFGGCTNCLRSLLVDAHGFKTPGPSYWEDSTAADTVESIFRSILKSRHASHPIPFPAFLHPFLSKVLCMWWGCRWLKCNGTQGNAVLPPPIYGSKRSPTSDCYNVRKRHTTIVRGPNLNVAFPHL